MQNILPNLAPRSSLFPPRISTKLHRKTKIIINLQLQQLKMVNSNPNPKRDDKKEKEKEKQQYWLLKTEPGEWSWEDQASNGGLSKWDGVKNHQALKNLKSARLHDLCFFYHSGTKSRRVVGVVTVVREWYQDDDVTGGGGNGGGAIDVKAVGEMRRAVDLKEMKEELKKNDNKEFGLFRQPRLSVVRVPPDVWIKICELGNGYEGDGVFESDGDDEQV